MKKRIMKLFLFIMFIICVVCLYKIYINYKIIKDCWSSMGRQVSGIGGVGYETLYIQADYRSRRIK